MYYAGSGDILTLAISQVGDTPVGCEEGSFMAYPGTLSTTGSNYRLTMPDDTVLITLAPVDFAAVNTGTEVDPYLIHNAEQWNLLASNVGIGTSYSGKHFRLAADITVTGMVGTSDYRFSGTFDGNGHTLTFNHNGGNSDHMARCKASCAIASPPVSTSRCGTWAPSPNIASAASRATARASKSEACSMQASTIA